VIDSTSVLYFQSDYLASGWRQSEVVTPNVFIPFSLSGQIVLDGTEARATGLYSYTRPPIHLNHHREYDPFTGGFLQPDPMDGVPRKEAEGYVLARNNSTRFSDSTGNQAYYIDSPEDTCRESKEQFTKMLWQAASRLMACSGITCLFEKIPKRAWLYNLFYSTYRCRPEREADGNYAIAQRARGAVHLYPDAFDEGAMAAKNDGCLAQVIAHEALHITLFQITEDYDSWSRDHAISRPLYFNQVVFHGRLNVRAPREYPNANEEDFVRNTTDHCKFCEPL
jgi:RHS repeat-associated protein